MSTGTQSLMVAFGEGAGRWWVAFLLLVATIGLVRQILVIAGRAEADAWWLIEPRTTAGKLVAIVPHTLLVVLCLVALVAA